MGTFDGMDKEDMKQMRKESREKRMKCREERKQMRMEKKKQRLQNIEEEKEMQVVNSTTDDNAVVNEETPEWEKFKKERRGPHGGLPPRKAIKKLIQQELEQQAPQLFEQLMSYKLQGKEFPADNSSKPEITTHQGVACDGCGINPLNGIRYKCCICKNFDFCEVCEEKVSHEHPFIKITHPSQNPVKIIAGVEEEEEKKQRKEFFHKKMQECGFEGKQNWREMFQGAGGRGRGGKHFKHIVRNIIDQIYQESGEEAPPKQHGKWKGPRAVILSKPESILEGDCGQIVLAEIEVQNQTKWPWKRGCYIGLNGATSEQQPLIVNDLFID